jgi:hypothetical protein
MTIRSLAPSGSFVGATWAAASLEKRTMLACEPHRNIAIGLRNDFGPAQRRQIHGVASVDQVPRYPELLRSLLGSHRQRTLRALGRVKSDRDGRTARTATRLGARG